MRPILAATLAISLIGSSAMAADLSVHGTLAPGKSAGVQQANMHGHALLFVAGAAVVVAAIVIVATNSGNAVTSSTSGSLSGGSVTSTTTTTTTS